MERGTLSVGLALVMLCGLLAGCTRGPVGVENVTPEIVVPRSAPPIFDLDLKVASDLLNISEEIMRNLSEQDQENVSRGALSMHQSAITNAREEIANRSYPRALAYAWESLWRTLEMASGVWNTEGGTWTKTDEQIQASNLENVTTLKAALDELAQEINQTRAEGKVPWGHMLRVEGDLIRAYLDYNVFVRDVYREPEPGWSLHDIRVAANSGAAWTWMRLAHARQMLSHAKEATGSGEPGRLSVINSETVERALSDARDSLRDLPTTPQGNATIVSPYLRATLTYPMALEIAQGLGWREAVFEMALEQAAFARVARFQAEGIVPTNEQFNATWDAMLRNATNPADGQWFFYVASYRDDFLTAQENDLPEEPFFLIAAWRTAEQLPMMHAARTAAFE